MYKMKYPEFRELLVSNYFICLIETKWTISTVAILMDSPAVWKIEASIQKKSGGIALIVRIALYEGDQQSQTYSVEMYIFKWRIWAFTLSQHRLCGTNVHCHVKHLCQGLMSRPHIGPCGRNKQTSKQINKIGNKTKPQTNKNIIIISKSNNNNKST